MSSAGRRINVVLAEETVHAIDGMAMVGQRSRFIVNAVQHYIAHGSAEAIRTRLERAIMRDQDIDREVSADWYAVDQNAWNPIAREER